MKVVSACSSENGSNYGLEGDQTGGEIKVQNWYSFPWDAVIVPLDADMGKKAASYAVAIANSSSFGYSWGNRWEGFKSIQALGSIEGAKGDFDCSSLVIGCYVLAGANIEPKGYTETMAQQFKQSGQFEIYTDYAHISSSSCIAGTIYLNTVNHTVIAVGDNPITLPAAPLSIPSIGAQAAKKEAINSTLSLGSYGYLVAALQDTLNRMGYQCGQVDKDFGANTEAAVKEFQKDNGLEVDGVVGPLTWKKILNLT